ncbi:MAG: SsrA-binding protein SmpB [bacterium]|nr:SsrA-binding protein SmpB [bacterium]
MANLAENRKAHFDYDILETFHAGIVLLGQEVKSIKLGRMQLQGSYVVFKGNEVFLVGSTVPPYQPKNTPESYNSERSRKLLLQKREISYLTGKSKEGGLTLIPLKVYTGKRGTIKLEFGLARGRKTKDKREELKKRETRREIERAFKQNA